MVVSVHILYLTPNFFIRSKDFPVNSAGKIQTLGTRRDEEAGQGDQCFWLDLPPHPVLESWGIKL